MMCFEPSQDPSEEAVVMGQRRLDGRTERHFDRNLREQVLRYLPQTRIVQWHGTEPGGRDHRSLAHFPREQSSWLLDTLLKHDFTGTLALEVFRPDDFETSLRIVHELLAELEA
jgi:hypothetical protein